MDEAVKVYFCDLCNESVPEKDVEAGAARTVKGKVVGVCCLPLLAGPGQPTAASPASVARSATSPAPVAFGSSLVFVGAVMLAAIAGATYYLDSHAQSGFHRHEQEIARIAGELGAQGSTLKELRTRSAEAASRQDVEAVTAQAKQAAGPISESVRGLEEKIAFGAARDQRSREELKKTLDNVAQRQAAADGVLAALGDDLKKMAGDLQAVRQMPLTPGTFGGGPPRAEPSEPMPGKPADSPAAGGDGGIPPALSHFVKQLSDPDAGTRWSAVEKLTGSGEKRVVAPLMPVLKDADPFVRRICAAGLGELGAREAAPGLIEALADGESIVRDAAYRSLRKLTGQNLAFDPEAGADKRAEGVRRWNEWWKANKDGFLAGK